MKSCKESLKAMCERCQKNINQIPSTGDRPFKECPWRGISGDYCEEYEIVKQACEKAERYDLIQENLTENHLTTDQEVEECNEYYIKQDAAKEIIEMIDAMCVDEKADVIWQSGAYIRNKYIAQKIKERYGIK